MENVREITEEPEWDEHVLALDGHPLQLWGWGELKAAHNWQVKRLAVEKDTQLIGVGQLLIRKLPWPFRSLLYLPRGPVARTENRAEVLEQLVRYCRQNFAATLLQAEPDWSKFPEVDGWHRSARTILIPTTLRLDLGRSEDELMAEMSKKTRQYVRKSSREDLDIRRVTDQQELTQLLEIYQQTAERAGFAIHDDRYYYDVAEKLGESSVVFAAFHGEKPIAFVWLAVSGEVAFELYGGMNEPGQQLRANYALKWHAIRRCKEWGIAIYDMNGLLNDGVSTFKRGFSHDEAELAGTWDYPLSVWYPAWRTLLPAAKKIIRKIKR